MADAPLISPEEVASVLQTDGADADGEDRAPSEGFTLRRPVGIAPSDEALAAEKLKVYAAGLGQALRRELDPEIGVEMKGFQQQQVRAALESMTAPLWVLAFTCAEVGGVALVVEAPCGLALVEVSMGGVGRHKAEARKPTPLEQRVVTGLTRSLTRRLAAAVPGELETGEFLIGALPPRLAAPGETVGAGLLSIKISEIEHRGLLLGTASLLREADENLAHQPGHIGPMAPRLARVPVEARPLLRAGRVSLADLVALKPGTVLQLAPKEDAPLELRIAGESLIRGRIAHRDGKPVFLVESMRGRPAAVQPAGTTPTDTAEPQPQAMQERKTES